jgi:hypothetical protein
MLFEQCGLKALSRASGWQITMSREIHVERDVLMSQLYFVERFLIITSTGKETRGHTSRSGILIKPIKILFGSTKKMYKGI